MSWKNDLTPEALERIQNDNPALLESETLDRYKTADDILGAHLEQRTVISQSIRIPPEEAGTEVREEFINKLVNNAPEVMLKPDFANPEQSTEFWQALGTPEDADKYQTPEEVNLQPEIEAQFREVSKGANLTNEQYQKLINSFAAMDTETKELVEAQKEKDQDALKAKWGLTLDDRLKAAEKVYDEFFSGSDFTSLGTAEIEGLFAVSKALTGGKPQVAGQPKAESGVLPPAEAERRAQEILNNPKLYDRNTPREEIVALMEKHKEYMMMTGKYVDSIDVARASFGG